MLGNIGLYSYGASFLAYLLLSGMAVVTMRGRRFGGLLLIASALTACWAGVIVVSTLLPYPQIKLMQFAEVARNAAWMYLLLQIMSDRLSGTDHLLASNRWVPWFCVALGLVLVALFSTPYLLGLFSAGEEVYQDLSFTSWLAIAITVLLLMEQIFRNCMDSERWSIKHLCLGLGFMFDYEF